VRALTKTHRESRQGQDLGRVGAARSARERAGDKLQMLEARLCLRKAYEGRTGGAGEGGIAQKHRARESPINRQQACGGELCAHDSGDIGKSAQGTPAKIVWEWIARGAGYRQIAQSGERGALKKIRRDSSDSLEGESRVNRNEGNRKRKKSK